MSGPVTGRFRYLIAAVTAGALLLVAGCSSAVDGQAQTGSVIPQSNAVTSSTVSSSTVSSSTTPTTRSSARTTTATSSTATTTPASTPETTDTAAVPTDLDPETAAWFTLFCGGAKDLQQYASPSTAGQSLTQAQATVVMAYADIATSASTTVTQLQATAPPPINLGTELQASAVARFSALADVYGRGSATIAALSPTSADDLRTAIDAVETEATSSLPQDTTQIDADVAADAAALPICAGVF